MEQGYSKISKPKRKGANWIIPYYYYTRLVKVMNQKYFQLFFKALFTVSLFSIWAVFALLVVNKSFYEDLPGYRIGRLCIWELFAIIVAVLITRYVTKKWGTVKLENVGSELKLTMNPKYGLYFIIYFLVGIIISVWQFWIFSQSF